jgi:hypothetical protein
MAMTFGQMVGGQYKQNVPKAAAANVPGVGNLTKTGANPWNTYRGPLAVGPQGGDYGGPAAGQGGAGPGNVLLAPGEAAKGGFWTTPDYKSMLPGDWEVLDAESAANQSRGSVEGSFQQALRTAFIDFGGSQDKLGKWAKYIDQPTIEQARTNKFSDMAQALTKYIQNLDRTKNTLTGQGMLSSGANTILSKKLLEARELAETMGLRTFTGGAERGEAGMLSAFAEIEDRRREAYGRAAQRLADANPSYYTDPVAATPPIYGPAGANPIDPGLQPGGYNPDIPGPPPAATYTNPATDTTWGTLLPSGGEWTKWLGKL